MSTTVRRAPSPLGSGRPLALVGFGTRVGRGSVSSFGASARRLEIGLGKTDRVESLEIFWPASGRRQVFRDLDAARLYRIRERAPAPASR